MPHNICTTLQKPSRLEQKSSAAERYPAPRRWHLASCCPKSATATLLATRCGTLRLPAPGGMSLRTPPIIAREAASKHKETGMLAKMHCRVTLGKHQAREP